ncbi:phosphate starvation-inducible protein PhoH [Paenibacillus pini JCM 16418]|uniref:PhoH-like protein n=1 Tax=Paenibacillus pini JCM 16418 TaxID=1236976 RepID=W7Y7Y8_9BACL|nr:phosphate starvation-inducible protein PhoH [Paenibacillus pini JCM 16418]
MSEHNHSIQISLQSAGEGLSIFGPQDTFLKLIEAEIPAKIDSREAEITIRGNDHDVQVLQQLFDVLLQLVRKGYILTERDVLYAIDLAKDFRADQLLDLYKGEITTTFRGKPIRVKTIGQKHYVTTIKKRDIVFGIGPAGTGKTYLAVVLAVAALKEGSVKKIVLTRQPLRQGKALASYLEICKRRLILICGHYTMPFMMLWVQIKQPSPWRED